MPRRRRVWSNSDASLSVIVPGQGGQKLVDIGANLQVGIGITHLAGFTVAMTHVDLTVMSSSDESGSSFLRAHWGIGIFAGGIDEGDFPDLSLYEGDWLAYGTYHFQLPGAISTLVLPTAQAVRSYESRGSRKIDRVGEVPFLVVQHSGAENVDYHFSVSQLWLMP